jgi:hypothetical protein
MLAQLQQRQHHNKGNNIHGNGGKDACTSTATMPLKQGQQCHCDDGEDNCALMMPTAPLQWGQQCQLQDGINAITMRATTPLWMKGNNTIVKGNNASLTAARTPACWQWGQHHCHEGSNRNCNNGKNAYTLTATMPWQQGQQRQLDNKWQGWQC